MMFVLGKLIGLLVQPSTLLLLCCVGGALLVGRGRREGGRRRGRQGAGRRLGWTLLVVGIGGFLAVLLLPLDQWILLPLEDRFPPPSVPPAHVDGIAVLGGAVMPELAAVRGQPALNAAAERMTETVALARRYPGARVVFTGGQGALLPGELSEADVARSLFAALGLPPERLTFETLSRTTAENAAMARALARPAPGETWLLVTSAAHMPRAVGSFRAAGWDVTAWPVGYKSGRAWRLWLPGELGLRLAQLDGAAHEWAGLLAYRLLGRTDALFPAP
jgi:uncharacterized SAM-binding protein YcdF (DUF218 family)